MLRLILRGEFPRGSRLPAETTLAERFGVSRPVIRAALERLRESGHVESRKGSGSVVIAGSTGGALSYPTIETIADLQLCYDFRIAVETKSAYYAALRRSEADLAALETSMDDARRTLESGAFQLGSDDNFAFHRLIAQASQNPFFAATIEAIPNIVGQGPIEVRFNGLGEGSERGLVVLEEHKQILDAIRERDGERASMLMYSHIDNARHHLFERHSF